MNWRRLAASVGLVLLTNAVVLAGVAYNRLGEADTEITLTEREIPLSYTAFQGDENTGLSLRLHWEISNKRWLSATLDPGPEWFDQAKLEAIGYDCSIPLTDQSAELYYDKLLPREGYVVLEYGGQAWRSWLAEWERDLHVMNDQLNRGQQSKQDVERLKEAYKRLPSMGSRLLVIDVGTDPIQLRQRYPDGRRFIIAKAQVRLALIRAGKTEAGEPRPAHVRGSVTRLLIDEIHVPLEWRETLQRLTYTGSDRGRIYPNTFVMHGEHKDPRYEVTLRYGKRHEPWITAIRPLITSP